ncbi:MAG: fused response regulator/phosphatase [Rhodospirillales bacterium]|nr:fused response regulator/phosphatase [Rhodospirillales bacterium]
MTAGRPGVLFIAPDQAAAKILRREGVVAAVAGDLAQALAELGQRPFDAVLLAAGATDGDPAQAVQSLLAVDPDLAILAWTRPDEEAATRDLVAAGALDRIGPELAAPEAAAAIDGLLADHRAARRLEKRRHAWLAGTRELRGRLEDELLLAWIAQKSLLPDASLLDEIEGGYGVAISAHVEPSSELGGDLWGVMPIDDWSFALYIVDFSGHGMAAALNTFRLHALVRELHAGAESPGAFLSALNARLAGQLAVGQFATMLYGIVDTAHDRFDYASAGAPPPLVVDVLTGDVAIGDGAGLPLGIAAKVRYAERRLALPPDGLLLLASDALAECPDQAGHRLGRAGAADLARRAALDEGGPLAVGPILEPFLKSVRRPLADDLTVVCCQRHGSIA